MDKIKIVGYFFNGLENNKINFNCFGIKTNNIIKYNKDQDEFTININKERPTFTKKNKETILKYIFNKNENNESFYNIIEDNLKIYLNILTKSVKIKDNTIDINFILENCESFLHLEYEVIK